MAWFMLYMLLSRKWLAMLLVSGYSYINSRIHIYTSTGYCWDPKALMECPTLPSRDARVVLTELCVNLCQPNSNLSNRRPKGRACSTARLLMMSCWPCKRGCSLWSYIQATLNYSTNFALAFWEETFEKLFKPRPLYASFNSCLTVLSCMRQIFRFSGVFWIILVWFCVPKHKKFFLFRI